MVFTCQTERPPGVSPVEHYLIKISFAVGEASPPYRTETARAVREQDRQVAHREGAGDVDQQRAERKVAAIALADRSPADRSFGYLMVFIGPASTY